MHWRPIVATALASAALLSCSSKKTIQTQQGTTTVETNVLHNTYKYSNKEGTAIIGKGAVDEAALGLPFYPGAIQSQTGAMAANTTHGISRQVSLTTKNPFNQVYEWYKRRMPAGSEQVHMETTGGSIATFLVGKPSDSEQKSVEIQASGDTTTILLSHFRNNG